MKLYIFDKAKNKDVSVGDWNPKFKIFTKKVSAKHYMRMMKGYGIQEEVIQMLKDKECQEIVIRTQSGMELGSTLDQWLAPNIAVRDFGHGVQRFLPVEKMKIKLETT